MRFVIGLLGSFGTVALATVATVTLPQVADALAPPKSGTVEVTGYDKQVALNGSAGPVTRVVNRREATVLRHALAGLPLKLSPSDCMESPSPFTVKFFAGRSHHPTMVASAFSCAGLGVSVMVGGATTSLQDDCAFQSEALAAFLPSQVRATRRVVAQDCPGDAR